MLRLTTPESLHAFRNSLATPSETLALVPTMGNLHAGHMALIQHAQQVATHTVVSIFVNPTQFGPNEDFNHYPRTLEADLQRCAEQGVHAVFTPTAETIYPNPNHSFLITPPKQLTALACGLQRPGHFEGVAQVVLKLLHLVQPHYAVFGEKDAQQLAIIKAMISDLMLPVHIVSHPTQREESGLAMSSRNQYLTTKKEHNTAGLLYKTMLGVQQLVKQGFDGSVAEGFQQTWQALQEKEPVSSISLQWEYQLSVNEMTFELEKQFSPSSRLLVAAKVNGVRLIDTLKL